MTVLLCEEATDAQIKFYSNEYLVDRNIIEHLSPPPAPSKRGICNTSKLYVSTAGGACSDLSEGIKGGGKYLFTLLMTIAD